MLSEIRLTRFKKFKSAAVKFSPFTILMGENSSGKTTVLQALNLALNMFASTNFVENHNGKVSLRRKGVGTNTLPGIGVSDARELFYGKTSRPKGKRTPKTGDTNHGALIELLDTTNNTYRLHITSMFGSFNVKCLSNAKDLEHNPVLQHYRPLFISGFVGLRTAEERSWPLAIQYRLISGEVSSVIRNLVFDIQAEDINRFNKLKSRLLRDFGFNLNNVLFDQQRDLYVRASYTDSVNNELLPFDFNSSGSGFMQILQILTPIYRYCPEVCKIVLLDEPDAHLHPNLQTALAKSLREIQNELGVQIIISTHSTSIIRAANPNEIVPISSSSDLLTPLLTSDQVEAEILDRIDAYSLGKSVISGKLVFFEDSNLEIFETFDKIANTQCLNGAYTVPVITGRGKDDKVPFYLPDVINKLLRKEIEIHLVRDGDSMTQEWRDALQRYAEKKGIFLHLLKRHEIENYIIEPELIFNAIQKRDPETNVTIEKIRDKIKEFLKSTISFSKFGFDRLIEESIHKTAQVVGLEEYRNYSKAQSEAIKIRSEYEKIDDLNDLLVYGLGKETLKLLLNYINSDLRIPLSKANILNEFKAEVAPKEIIDILKAIQSKEKALRQDSLKEIEAEKLTDVHPMQITEDSDAEDTDDDNNIEPGVLTTLFR